LESLMNGARVRMKSVELSGTNNNFVRQMDAVVRK
jgi:hypothetical protein